MRVLKAAGFVSIATRASGEAPRIVGWLVPITRRIHLHGVLRRGLPVIAVAAAAILLAAPAGATGTARLAQDRYFVLLARTVGDTSFQFTQTRVGGTRGHHRGGNE